MDKVPIRKQLLALRMAQLKNTKKKKDEKIRKRLTQLPFFKKARGFFTYLPHKGEVDTTALIHDFFGKKKIFVPKVKGRGLKIFELQHPEKLQKGAFGIHEPLAWARAVSSAQANIALIPGIAFDRTGHRIGFGVGYFDRWLKKFRGTTFGLAYEFQIIENVPAHAYDVPVDFIVTEKRLIQCQRFRNKTTRFTKSSKAKRAGSRKG